MFHLEKQAKRSYILTNRNYQRHNSNIQMIRSRSQDNNQINNSNLIDNNIRLLSTKLIQRKFNKLVRRHLPNFTTHHIKTKMLLLPLVIFKLNTTELPINNPVVNRQYQTLVLQEYQDTISMMMKKKFRIRVKLDSLICLITNQNNKKISLNQINHPMICQSTSKECQN